jgi:hypothetical protein
MNDHRGVHFAASGALSGATIAKISCTICATDVISLEIDSGQGAALETLEELPAGCAGPAFGSGLHQGHCRRIHAWLRRRGKWTDPGVAVGRPAAGHAPSDAHGHHSAATGGSVRAPTNSKWRPTPLSQPSPFQTGTGRTGGKTSLAVDQICPEGRSSTGARGSRAAR